MFRDLEDAQIELLKLYFLTHDRHLISSMFQEQVSLYLTEHPDRRSEEDVVKDFILMSLLRDLEILEARGYIKKVPASSLVDEDALYASSDPDRYLEAFRKADLPRVHGLVWVSAIVLMGSLTAAVFGLANPNPDPSLGMLGVLIVGFLSSTLSFLAAVSVHRWLSRRR